MKKYYGIILFFFISLPAIAHHIIGGEMYYVSKGKNGNNYSYQIVLKLYRGCEEVDRDHAALDPYVGFTIWNNDDGTYSVINNITLDGPHELNNQNQNPCIINPPPVCYQVGYYRTSVSLPLNKKGYTIAFQRCCRSDLLLNADTRGQVGASYFTVVPGTENGIPGDNSPVFNGEEAVLICSTGKLQYSYSATDPDGDKLVYSFYPGNVGGGSFKDNNAPVPTSPPPFPTFNYFSGFTGTSPLGPEVTINPNTGEITGRPHLREGSYDITVRVQAYRNGKLIATHLKDFQVAVHNCERVVLADIPPLFDDCKGYTINFPNNSTLGKTYRWDFGDGGTSSEYTPVHTYKQPGTYHISMLVEPDSPCGDSINAIAKIFPGLKADFSAIGNCLQFPTQFKNKSSVSLAMDKVSSWSWDFGVPGSYSDTSSASDISYQYTSPATYQVMLKVATDSGCVQSDTQSVVIYDKPVISMIPDDTIMCYKDNLGLKATSIQNGTYQWAPLYQITGANTATPTVHPLVDTTYRVTFTDNQGCSNSDSVHLRIKRTLQVNAGNDTTICKGDPVVLHATSDENYAFSWYDKTNNIVASTRNTAPIPAVNEVYTVKATLGSCEAEDAMSTKVAPYPDPIVTPEQQGICYGEQIQLHANGGAFYHWTPGGSLSDSAIADPVASPIDTTIYTVTVTDTLGCPKPVSKQALIMVIPPVPAFAGNDTIITTGQSFQLHATGGNQYNWTPTLGLSDAFIADPMVNWNRDISYQVKVTQLPEGCFAYDTINVRYIVGPDIYVPTAFTPNGDGMNDVFRPIPVGINKINYFRVYNRWGQIVFETTQYMKGWDGNFNGKPAVAGGYVWMVEGEDFKGDAIVKKGTVLLIR